MGGAGPFRLKHTPWYRVFKIMQSAKGAGSLAWLLALGVFASQSLAGLPPIVEVPGLASSVLHATWDLTNQSNPYQCPDINTDTTHVIWTDATCALPYARDCWRYEILTEYDYSRKSLRSRRGVNVTVPYWGLTNGIDNIGCIDPTHENWCLGLSKIFQGLNDHLRSAMNYTNTTLYGAPYDWRLVPDKTAMADYFRALQALIESAYTRNGNTRVLTICHSLGCPLLAVFFSTYVSDEWKQTHIVAHVNIAGAFGGATKALRVALSGENFGVFTTANSFFQELQVPHRTPLPMCL